MDEAYGCEAMREGGIGWGIAKQKHVSARKRLSVILGNKWFLNCSFLGILQTELSTQTLLLWSFRSLDPVILPDLIISNLVIE